MKRMLSLCAALVAGVALVALVGCAPKQDAPEPTTPENPTSTALVVAARDGQVLLVDQETETLYYPTLPDGTPELAPGNVVRVSGNGIMLESYPGQYPGITSVEVVSEGTPADAEKYSDLVAEVWPEKDPSEPALASVEYRTEQAVVTILPMECGYTWTFEEDGETMTVSADAPHPVEYAAQDLPDVSVGETVEASVSFDVPATDVTVRRWSEMDILGSAAPLDGEAVEVELADGSATFNVGPGFRYAVNATFDAGEVLYVFTVPTV